MEKTLDKESNVSRSGLSILNHARIRQIISSFEL